MGKRKSGTVNPSSDTPVTDGQERGNSETTPGRRCHEKGQSLTVPCVSVPRMVVPRIKTTHLPPGCWFLSLNVCVVRVRCTSRPSDSSSPTPRRTSHPFPPESLLLHNLDPPSPLGPYTDPSSARTSFLDYLLSFPTPRRPHSFGHVLYSSPLVRGRSSSPQWESRHLSYRGPG